MRRGNHGERAFAAGEEAGDVVARVVLLEAGHAPDNPGIGEDRFDAKEL